MGTHSIELLRMSGKISSVDEAQQARLLLELEQAQDLCGSPSLNQLVVNSFLPVSDLQKVPPTAEFSVGTLLPFTEDHVMNGMQKLWYPEVDSRYVRTDENGAKYFLSVTSYWPALHYGVGSVLRSRPSSSQSSNEVCIYGLQPCVRPEKRVDQWRRIAFTQAHIDFVSWHQDQVTLCRKAIECICQAVVQLTGLSLQNIRVRVGDARGWASLLASHFSPRTIQALRMRLLDPIAGTVALRGGDTHLLAQRAALFLRRLGQDRVPDQFLRMVTRWIETGDYELEYGMDLDEFRYAEVHQLIQSCKAKRIHAMVDARSARAGYSGLTWQVDCKTSQGWIEVAGGGDYTDAALLYGCLHSDVFYDPATIVVGSAVGVHRALAISRDPGAPEEHVA